ncbi:MAG: hypothetical protein V4640_11855 [Verrucomicrobiota bacterium]
MKKIRIKFLLNLKNLCAVGALLTIPLTVYAGMYDYSADFFTYASVGSNITYGLSSSYSTLGILMVGQQNAINDFNGYSYGYPAQNILVTGSYNIGYDSDSAVIGHWNKDTGGDELLILGNGTSSVPSNALEVFKDGKMNVKGVVTCLPGGNIPMFTGN